MLCKPCQEYVQPRTILSPPETSSSLSPLRGKPKHHTSRGKRDTHLDIENENRHIRKADGCTDEVLAVLIDLQEEEKEKGACHGLRGIKRLKSLKKEPLGNNTSKPYL